MPRQSLESPYAAATLSRRGAEPAPRLTRPGRRHLALTFRCPASMICWLKLLTGLSAPNAARAFDVFAGRRIGLKRQGDAFQIARPSALPAGAYLLLAATTSRPRTHTPQLVALLRSEPAQWIDSERPFTLPSGLCALTISGATLTHATTEALPLEDAKRTLSHYPQLKPLQASPLLQAARIYLDATAPGPLFQATRRR